MWDVKFPNVSKIRKYGLSPSISLSCFFFLYFFLVVVVAESVYLTPTSNETDCALNNWVVFFIRVVLNCNILLFLDTSSPHRRMKDRGGSSRLVPEAHGGCRWWHSCTFSWWALSQLRLTRYASCSGGYCEQCLGVEIACVNLLVKINEQNVSWKQEKKI